MDPQNPTPVNEMMDPAYFAKSYKPGDGKAGKGHSRSIYDIKRGTLSVPYAGNYAQRARPRAPGSPASQRAGGPRRGLQRATGYNHK